LDEPDRLNESAPYRHRIQLAKTRLAELEEDTREQLEEFESLWATLTECFDVLEIVDRGEFTEQGTDISPERVDRIAELITGLRTDISERRPRFADLCANLTRLHQLLELPPFQAPETLGDPTFESLESEKSELMERLQTNKDKATILLKAIRWLERVLTSQRVTSENLKSYSDDQLEKLQARLTRLEQQKEDHMPEYVESMKRELLSLWGELHIPVPPATEFPFVYNSPATKRTLVALESEVLRLQHMRDQVTPMLELVAARDEIISQYQSWDEVSKDPNRLTSRRGKMASLLIEEERIRRRYNADLPRIHAKLIPMLEEYEQTFGEPFRWDGVNLLEVVADAHKKEEASFLQAKVRQARKKTPKSQKVKGPNSLIQRAPFQLQEFMF
jgi:protein regulator of cytokinesis 1